MFSSRPIKSIIVDKRVYKFSEDKSLFLLTLDNTVRNFCIKLYTSK